MIFSFFQPLGEERRGPKSRCCVSEFYKARQKEERQDGQNPSQTVTV
jgi:hypothetical protein